MLLAPSHNFGSEIYILFRPILSIQSNWRFYHMSISPKELYQVLCTPAVLKVMKKAVYSEYRKQESSYAAQYFSREGLLSEVQLLIISRIETRCGFEFPFNHSNLSNWLYTVFQNAAKDVLRKKNRKGSRIVSTENTQGQDSHSESKTVDIVSSSEGAFAHLYESELLHVKEVLSPLFVLRSSTILSKNRVLLYLMLNFPEEVSFEDFAAAENFSRSLEDIWRVWNACFTSYTLILENDTPCRQKSRVFLVWLLRGEGYSTPQDFRDSEPDHFATCRDTLRKTLNRCQEDIFRIILVKASLMALIADELLIKIANVAVPYIYSGPTSPFVASLCIHRKNHNVLARLLFSSKTSLTGRLNDEKKTCQNRFAYYRPGSCFDSL
jgi:DNA-directed RNA polymerase specialized sigma24 family protein